MNTANVFIHYVEVPPELYGTGYSYGVSSMEDICLVGQLVGGVVQPLQTVGGEHYHPAYLSAPSANFRILEAGRESEAIACDLPGAQLVVLSEGGFPPYVDFHQLSGIDPNGGSGGGGHVGTGGGGADGGGGDPDSL